jgi:tetratricopeptide (TPR) repeat protein
MDPFGFHLTNLLGHGASSGVVFLLSLRLLGPGPANWNRLAAAAFAALLFGVHPLRAESVAWVSERRDVLSVFFYLLCVHLYLPAAAEESRGWRRFAGSFAAFSLSLLAKGMAVTAPAVLLLLDVYPLGRLRLSWTGLSGRQGRAVLLEKLPFLAAGLVVGAVGWVGQLSVNTTMTVVSFGWVQRLMQAFYGAAFYVRKTLLPLDLSPLYLHPSADPFAAPYLTSAAAALGLTGLFVALRRRWPAGLACWAVYLAVLFPVIGFMPFGPQIAADRYSYAACVPWALLAGAGLLRVLEQGGALRAWALAGAALLAGVLGGLAWNQTKVWRSSETLWRQALAVRENHPVAHTNLGVILSGAGRLGEALGHLSRAVELAPSDPMVRNNLGCALASAGRLSEAEQEFRASLRIRPSHAEARRNLERVLALSAREGVRGSGPAPGPGIRPAAPAPLRSRPRTRS